MFKYRLILELINSEAEWTATEADFRGHCETLASEGYNGKPVLILVDGAQVCYFLFWATLIGHIYRA